MLEDLRKLWNRINGSTELELTNLIENERAKKEQLIRKTMELNDMVYQLSKDENGKAAKIVELAAERSELLRQMSGWTMRVREGEIAIESLKAELALTGEPQSAFPDFLQEGSYPYLPRRQFVTKDGMDTALLSDAREIYALFQFHKGIVSSRGWKKLSRHQKLMAIWKFVCSQDTRKYEYDRGDNWQLALDTYYRKRGDCEDSSILFVTFARAAGISPSEVFLAVGPTSFGYHAFPIVYYSPKDAQDAFGNPESSGWYVFEATLEEEPVQPIPLAGSVYGIDNGLQNWQHAGQIKPEALAMFNGQPRAPAGPVEIENSERKNALIQEYWKKFTRIR
ncbi:MAG: transglutaminase family protein [Candidatus Micrarchaeia archaeon]|jgi:hypothetical protein